MDRELAPFRPAPVYSAPIGGPVGGGTTVPPPPQTPTHDTDGEAKRQLDHTTVRAPFNGIVTNVPDVALRVRAEFDGSATR